MHPEESSSKPNINAIRTSFIVPTPGTYFSMLNI
jgi:hypothetical protein